MFRSLRMLGLLAFLGCSFNSYAEETQPITPTLAPTHSSLITPGFHVTLHLGLTFGGDTVAQAPSDSGTKELKAGENAQFGLGGLYQFESTPMAILVSGNYHQHLIKATNGEMKFSRTPIEILGYYTGWERFRLGGGVRLVNSPEAHVTINGQTESMTYDNATGLVLECGYQTAPSLWLTLRYVSEKYQPNTFTSTSGVSSSAASSKSLDGSHAGLGVIFMF